MWDLIKKLYGGADLCFRVKPTEKCRVMFSRENAKIKKGKKVCKVCSKVFLDFLICENSIFNGYSFFVVLSLDDGTEQLFAQPPNIAPATVSEDLNIHIHKEGGTGGGICAKVVFFLLFSALVVLIGLIITEHRGLTDCKFQTIYRSNTNFSVISFISGYS